MMKFLQLPTELIEEILYQAIKVRGLARAHRLRLVNKYFSRTVMEILYRSGQFHKLCIDFRHMPELQFRPYLAYRLEVEPENGKSLFNCLKHVAKIALDAQTTPNRSIRTIYDCINAMWGFHPWRGGWCYCSKCHAEGKCYEIFENRDGTCEVADHDFENYLFAAALCTNCLPVVQQIAAKDENLRSKLDYLQYGLLVTPSHAKLAAKYADKELLSYLLEIVPRTFLGRLRESLLWYAVQAGRADVLPFLYDFKKNEIPWNFAEPLDQRYDMLSYAPKTTNVEAMRFVESLFDLHSHANIQRWCLRRCLDNCICEGSIPMLEYLFQLDERRGAERDAESHYRLLPDDETHIRSAAYKGHIDMVKWFLERGARPQSAMFAATASKNISLVKALLVAGAEPFQCLYRAVESGQRPLVHLLLDAGADPNEIYYSSPAILAAITRENTEMVEVLVKRGAKLKADSILEPCVCRAKVKGLDSMLMLLQSHGVDTYKNYDCFPECRFCLIY